MTRGVKFEDEALDIEEKTSVDYLEIPVLLFLGLGTGAATPYIVVGPTFSFEVKCLVDGGADEDEDCDDTVGPLSERKKFDVGPMFGAGLAFPAGPGSLIVDGRYYLGLMNIIDDDTDASFKHRTLAFAAGYQIPLSVR